MGARPLTGSEFRALISADEVALVAVGLGEAVLVAVGAADVGWLGDGLSGAPCEELGEEDSLADRLGEGSAVLFSLPPDVQLCTIEITTKIAASAAQPLARLLKLKRLNHPIDESINLVLGVATPLGFKNTGTHLGESQL